MGRGSSCALAVVAALAVACGQPVVAPSTAPAPELQAVIVASELAVGPQRVPIGIIYRNTPVNDADVRVRAYRSSPSDPLATESDAPFKGEGLEGKGAYVAQLSFGAAGQWVADIAVRRGPAVPSFLRVGLKVAARSRVPAVGDPAPASRDPTKNDVADIGEIDSGLPPNDMHDLSIADAIAQHRPALVVFATPAFCTSLTCGPQVRAVQRLEPSYRDRLAFIHVEIYRNFRTDPAKRELTPTVLEWHLQSEPWVFLIDGTGVVRAAFEGPTAVDEIRDAIDRLLASR